MVTVRFDPADDLIYVVGRLRGPLGDRRVRLAVDTACAVTLITHEALSDAGYSARDGESLTRVTTALGEELGYRLRVARFHALGHTSDDFLMNAHDLAEGCGVDGLLGLNFLQQFNYEVRSREGRIQVERA